MRRQVTLVVLAGVVVLAACSSGASSKSASPAATTTSAPTAPGSTAPGTTPTTAPATPDPQVWLCKPDQPNDPCRSSMNADVIAADGTKTLEETAAATDPKIDCFYVYPTVSRQKTTNSNLTIEPAEVSVAVAQASRYSSVCRVFAPMYRQITLAGLLRAGRSGGAIAFAGVAAAWKDYLARYNDGRGVVLIGHSQGSFLLRPLIRNVIDPNPAVRAKIVSAILLGGNVVVPTGKDVGGDFEHIPACRSASQVGCVIAFSSFDRVPPPNAMFGRAPNAGEQVLCTNPAALGGGSAPLDTYLPTNLGAPPTPAGAPATEPAPWRSYKDLFAGECKSEGGASWLQIDDVRKPGDTRPKLIHSLPAGWGLHLYDGQIALGNLVDVVKSEAAAYHPAG